MVGGVKLVRRNGLSLKESTKAYGRRKMENKEETK